MGSATKMRWFASVVMISAVFLPGAAPVGALPSISVPITSTNLLASVDCVDASTCAAIDDSARLLATTDGGLSWSTYGTKFSRPAKSNLVVRTVDCATEDFCVVTELVESYSTNTARYSFHWTADHGRTWRSMGAERPVQGAWCFHDGRCFVKIYGSFFLLRAKGRSVSVSRSYISWSQTTQTISCPTRLLCTAAGDVGHGPLSGPTFSKSTDGGRTWRLVFERGRVGSVSCVSVKRCIGTAWKNPFKYSTDGGRTFTTIAKGLSVSSVGQTVCVTASVCLAEVVAGGARTMANVVFPSTGPPTVSLAPSPPAFVHPQAQNYGIHCKSRNFCIAPAPERRSVCRENSVGFVVMCAGIALEGVSPLRLPAFSEDGGRSWTTVNPLSEAIVAVPRAVPAGFGGTSTCGNICGPEHDEAVPVVQPRIREPMTREEANLFVDHYVTSNELDVAPGACPWNIGAIEAIMRAEGWEQTMPGKALNPYYSAADATGASDAAEDARYAAMRPTDRLEANQSEWKKGAVHAIVRAVYAGPVTSFPTCMVKIIYSNGPIPRMPG